MNPRLPAAQVARLFAKPGLKCIYAGRSNGAIVLDDAVCGEWRAALRCSEVSELGSRGARLRVAPVLAWHRAARHSASMAARTQQAKGGEMNTITAIALVKGRHYIAPEDVQAAIDAHPDDIHRVRIDALEVLGGQTGFGTEDHDLCAFVEFRGTASEAE